MTFTEWHEKGKNLWGWCKLRNYPHSCCNKCDSNGDCLSSWEFNIAEINKPHWYNSWNTIQDQDDIIAWAKQQIAALKIPNWKSIAWPEVCVAGTVLQLWNIIDKQEQNPSFKGKKFFVLAPNEAGEMAIYQTNGNYGDIMRWSAKNQYHRDGTFTSLINGMTYQISYMRDPWGKETGVKDGI